MKRIAVVCNYQLNPKRIGGMDRFFVAYDRACKEREIDVAWFFSNSDRHDFYKHLKIFTSRESSAEQEFLKQFGSNYHIIVTHFVQLCTPFFKQIKDSFDPYIIAVDHNPRPLYGFPLKKRLKNRLKGKLYSRYIDRFVGVSRYTADCIAEDYGSNLRKKTTVVYNGIDTSIYQKRTEVNRGKFIVASHLRESKGIQDLIEAVKTLPEIIRERIEVDIFGEGPLEKGLKDTVAAYNLQEQFSFNGSSSQLPELFKNYSYLLQPTYMECFSLSILESLAANVPVITTRVGGNPEIISHGINGLIFKVGDPRDLANLLEKVMTGEICISKNVSTLIEQEYNLKKMVTNHINLLPCT